MAVSDVSLTPFPELILGGGWALGWEWPKPARLGYPRSSSRGDRNMDPPETRYAKSGDLSIAYQVAGSGPLDLVIVPGFVSNRDVQWATPGLQHFFSRLAIFSGLIRFDKRGTGLSDRMSGVANLEDRMDDVRAVMDAVGFQRAALFGSPRADR